MLPPSPTSQSLLLKKSPLRTLSPLSLLQLKCLLSRLEQQQLQCCQDRIMVVSTEWQACTTSTVLLQAVALLEFTPQQDLS